MMDTFVKNCVKIISNMPSIYLILVPKRINKKDILSTSLSSGPNDSKYFLKTHKIQQQIHSCHNEDGILQFTVTAESINIKCMQHDTKYP